MQNFKTFFEYKNKLGFQELYDRNGLWNCGTNLQEEEWEWKNLLDMFWGPENASVTVSYDTSFTPEPQESVERFLQYQHMFSKLS